MKHSVKITILLIAMFFVAQIIGIFVANAYLPDTAPGKGGDPNIPINKSDYKLPYGLDPPADVSPISAGTSIIIALFIAVILMFTLMKLKAETFLRIWFLLVVGLGIAIALNAFLINIPNSAIISVIIAAPLAISKVFQRNMIVHNATEVLIYPGIATVFIPLLNIPIVIALLLLISVYDMYAVWHAGFMQKMAKYQIEKLRIFSGFFVPYMGKKDREKLKKAQKSKTKSRSKKSDVKVNVAILGGGDVVFPIILAGVVLAAWGLAQALIIALGATVALALLFYYSQKGKFYPAMPFITAGCLVALGIAYLI